MSHLIQPAEVVVASGAAAAADADIRHVALHADRLNATRACQSPCAALHQWSPENQLKRTVERLSMYITEHRITKARIHLYL